LFVLGKDVSRNALVIGPREQLGKKEMALRDVNWVSGCAPKTSIRAMVKIRYQAKPVGGKLAMTGDNSVHVVLDDLVAGITPGQSAVFYDGDVCLGGGIISDRSNL
jgi:tRNA-specific 2-thiouridylase